MFKEDATVTKSQRKQYNEVDSLRELLRRTLTGKKFKLDCGHHVTFGHFLGNNVTIYNGKDFKIICSLCGY